VVAMDLIHLIKFYLHVYHKWHKSRSADSTASWLRIIRRLNLIVSQPFLCICVGQYTIIIMEVTTQEYVYNISCIQYFLYKYIL